MNNRIATNEDATPGRRSGWLAMALIVPLGVWLITVGIMSVSPVRGNIDLAEGRQVFRAQCGSCHFAKEGFPAHHGPNLHDIGRTAASRRPDRTAAEYILESILEPDAFVSPSSRPGMPKNLATELAPGDIRNLVAFLASCGAFPDYEEIARLEIPDRRSKESERYAVRREDMQLAVQVLQEKGSCFQCHSSHHQPEYQVFAPAIFGVGLTDYATVRQSIVEPGKVVLPAYRCVNVVLATGRQLTGKLVSRTDDHVTLMTFNEGNRIEAATIPMTSVEAEDDQPLIEESESTMMPSGFAELLTQDELESVVTLIRQLN